MAKINLENIMLLLGLDCRMKVIALGTWIHEKARYRLKRGLSKR